MSRRTIVRPVLASFLTALAALTVGACSSSGGDDIAASTPVTSAPATAGADTSGSDTSGSDTSGSVAAPTDTSGESGGAAGGDATEACAAWKKADSIGAAMDDTDFDKNKQAYGQLASTVGDFAKVAPADISDSANKLVSAVDYLNGILAKAKTKDEAKALAKDDPKAAQAQSDLGTYGDAIDEWSTKNC